MRIPFNKPAQVRKEFEYILLYGLVLVRSHLFRLLRWKNLIDHLVQEEGVPIISNEEHFGFLDIYCREHLNKYLKELKNQQIGSIQASWYQCKVTP